MSEPPVISREDLYANWHEWVTANLGGEPTLAAIAATAATEAAIGGGGFNSAAESARAAWDANQKPSGSRASGRLDWAAVLAVSCGVVSIIVPLDTTFTFPIFAILGLVLALHCFWQGRLIGGLLSALLSLVGGMISLLSIWGGGGYI